MTFDQMIDRRNTDCAKWDMMQDIYGVSPEDGIAMWVADTDFQVPQVIRDKLRALVDHGVFGYTAFEDDYTAAIQWWMEHRHGWKIEADWIFTTTGIVNAVGMCMDAFTQPGDGVVVFSPVYHAFAKVIRLADRKLVECEMINDNGRYLMDFDRWDAQMTGSERMLILCSPHNPGGRVWTRDELQGVADFAKRHDLILVSDEIHHDLVMPGHTHIPMALVDPTVNDRLVMLTAPSKTFNVAGLHTGNVIIGDPALRATFRKRMQALYLGGNTMGQAALMAAYSPEGAAWVDEQMAYIDGNRQVFDAAIAEIPGLRSMRLESTFLAWVDFSGTGMTPAEVIDRVQNTARIAANHGDTFGTGGETFLRFNLGTQRARIVEACDRLRAAFADLQ